jgi:hypothetical protein
MEVYFATALARDHGALQVDGEEHGATFVAVACSFLTNAVKGAGQNPKARQAAPHDMDTRRTAADQVYLCRENSAFAKLADGTATRALVQLVGREPKG